MRPPLPVPPFAHPPTAADAPEPVDTVETVETDAENAGGRRRVGRVLALIAAVVLIALLAGGIGVTMRQGAVNTQRDRADTAARQNDALKVASRQQARKISVIQSQLSARQVVIAKQNHQLATLQQQQAAAKKEQAALDRTKAQLDKREAGLNARAAALNQQQQQQPRQQNPVQQPPPVVQSITFGDGLYHVGVDIPAGTYHADGGPTCYWATLSDSNANSILNDHSGPGQQTATVNAPYFASNGCGTWTKVG
jgi:hypothetical protein